MVRLTFVGDIALDKPLLKAAKARGNGKYDFSGVFHTRDVFSESDLVIGNMETCFGGGRRFNRKPYHYNSPDSFCRAVRNAGIDLVSTANNHCLDEGINGLARTNRLLEECGIQHTGTYSEETADRFLVKEIGGLKIAFYSLTYSVNKGMESLACDDLYRNVNLIGFNGKPTSWLKRYYRYVIKSGIKEISRKMKKQSTIFARQDSFHEEKINKTWMKDIENQILRAKAQSDFLVVLLHIGGQFVPEPGDYSKYMMDKLCSLGADIVVGNHPHTIQRIENRKGKIVAYSLGGYCMSVSGEYLVHDCLPEYSLALHVDIDEHTKALSSSVDVLKGTEDRSHYLTVKRADEIPQEILARIS
ncbi:MAG: CapA family protein [Clostridia bacterium]|nr:CapA family protein [Clostridia bacterium]